MRYMMIRYIGKLEPRHDNVVPRSGRVWEKSGSVLRVPEDEAYVYLNYPAVWDLAKAESVAHELVDKFNEDASVDLLLGMVGMLTRVNMRKVQDLCMTELAGDEQPSEKLNVDLKNPGAIAAHTKRVQKIAEAISLMIPGDPDAFDRAGAPILKRVRELSKITDATKRDVTAALAFNRKIA